MKRILVILVGVVLMQTNISAQRDQKISAVAGKILFTESQDGELRLRKIFNRFNKDQHDNPRLVAIALDASLGLLGVHRLYLGTTVKVPVIYTLTCGGGCVLWLIDLGLLIFTKDITPYMDNPNVFMWTEKKK
ncbi:MAG: NINE protein [Flavobacteriales bacterium]